MMNKPVTASLALLALLATAPALAQTRPVGTFDERFKAARELATSGKRAEALSAYSALLRTSPGNADVLVSRGRLNSWMGRWSEAELDLLAATRNSPSFRDAWSALGDLYYWRGRPDKAVGAYSRWVSIAPNDPDALISRGKAYRALGKNDAAKRDLLAAAARGGDVTALIEVPRSASTFRPPSTAKSKWLPTSMFRSADINDSGKYRWSAGLGVDRMNNLGGPDFTDTTLSIRHKWDAASLGFEALQTNRFGRSDRAYALDGYAGLWSRAYANLRYQYSPDALLFPRSRVRAELFQGVGTGWEISGAYDRLGFKTPVELMSVGVGKYVGAWYFRWRHIYSPGSTTNPGGSNNDRLSARYFYNGNSDQYVEASGGFGRSDPPTTASPTRAVTRSATFGVTWAGLVTDQVGYKLTYSHGYGLESEPYHQNSFGGSVFTRW